MPYNRGNYRAPVVTKKKFFEGCKCGLCKQPMLARQLSKDPFEKEYEIKWGIHWVCHKAMSGFIDRETR